jgi:hypothetical protein
MQNIIQNTGNRTGADQHTDTTGACFYIHDLSPGL